MNFEIDTSYLESIPLHGLTDEEVDALNRRIRYLKSIGAIVETMTPKGWLRGKGGIPKTSDREVIARYYWDIAEACRKFNDIWSKSKNEVFVYPSYETCTLRIRPYFPKGKLKEIILTGKTYFGNDDDD